MARVNKRIRCFREKLEKNKWKELIKRERVMSLECRSIKSGLSEEMRDTVMMSRKLVLISILPPAVIQWASKRERIHSELFQPFEYLHFNYPA